MKCHIICTIDFPPRDNSYLPNVPIIPTHDLPLSTWTHKLISIANLTDTLIQYHQHIPFGSHVRFHNLHQCTVILPTCEANVFVRHCTDTFFILTSSQLRIDSSSNCCFCTYTYGPPVMESSTSLTFHAYPRIDSWGVHSMWSINGNQVSVTKPLPHGHPCDRGLRPGGDAMYLSVKDYTPQTL